MSVPTVSQHPSLKTLQPYLGLLLKRPLENRKLKVSSSVCLLWFQYILLSVHLGCFFSLSFCVQHWQRHFKITGFSKLIFTLCLRRCQLSPAQPGCHSGYPLHSLSLCLPPPLTYFSDITRSSLGLRCADRFCPSALCWGQSWNWCVEVTFMCTARLVNIQSLLSPPLFPGFSVTGWSRALICYVTDLPGRT